MHSNKQSSVSLELETLEDRSLPNNFTAAGYGFDPTSLLPKHSQSDADKLYSAASLLAYEQNLVHADVIPPIGPLGTVYNDLSVAWWKYAYSVPANQSPFLDGTGANFAANQSGPVWYLAGSFSSFDPTTGNVIGPATYTDPATVTRTVEMPAGKLLYFPILNTEWDNLSPGGPDNTFTVSQLRQNAIQQMNVVTGMELDVDGVQVHDLKAYRTGNPVFSYNLPANNIVGVPARTVSPAVGDGYYILLEPLAPGKHTIHFTGGDPPSALSGPTGYGENITYHITVDPKK